MSIIETVGLKPAPPKMSPRYMQRRTGDDKAANQHRRPVGPFDPLAATAGVSSSHYRRRVGDDRKAAAAAAAEAEAIVAVVPEVASPPSVAWNLHEIRTDIDDGMPELRRRITAAAAAKSPRRLSRPLAWSLACGTSIVLWFGIAELVSQL